jgi:CRP-like cAMP-binding protein
MERQARKQWRMRTRDWLPLVVQAASVKRRLKAGEALFRAGDRALGLYEIVSGTVRLVRVERTGREAVLHAAAPGETFAEASLFSPTYHCDAVAATDAVVRLYPKAAVLNELDRDTKAARAFMAMLSRQVMSLRSRLEQRNIRSARERVRHYLVANAGDDGRTVMLARTLKEVANELGLTHEALYRTLAQMAATGEIERQKGRIRLLARPPI